MTPSAQDRPNGHKVRKDVENQNSIVEFGYISTFITWYREYSFFSRAQGTLTKITDVVCHQEHL